MAPETDRLYVVAFPDLAPGDAAALEALRAAHDPGGHALLAAHFTFVFGCTGVPAPAVEAAMRETAAAAQPIAFRLSRAALSLHGDMHYVFLLPDEGARAMHDLHRRLHAGQLAACLAGGQAFEPHMTVAKAARADEARTALAWADRPELRISGTLRALTLGRLADSAFDLITQAPLG